MWRNYGALKNECMGNSPILDMRNENELMLTKAKNAVFCILCYSLLMSKIMHNKQMNKVFL